MTIESATSISQLDASLPPQTDMKREGAGHLRLLKSVLKAQFPNFGTAAMTATVAELNFVAGVTSGIQAQFTALNAAKAAKGGDTYTGAHDFTGATVTGVTQASGDNSTKFATTAFVAQIALNASLPGQTGNAGKFVQTNGTNAQWAGLYGTISVISGPTTATPGNSYVFTSSLTLTLPASPGGGTFVTFQDLSGTGTSVIARNGQPIMGLAEDMTLDATNYPFALVYVDATRGWVIFT